MIILPRRRTGIAIMARARTVNSSTFKAQCLALIKEVNSGKLDEIIVTRRGRPAARVTAAGQDAGIKAGYGFMKGSVTLAEGVDLTQPVIDMPADWPPAPPQR
jgi:prevent-host-death family protein